MFVPSWFRNASKSFMSFPGHEGQKENASSLSISACLTWVRLWSNAQRQISNQDRRSEISYHAPSGFPSSLFHSHILTKRWATAIPIGQERCSFEFGGRSVVSETNLTFRPFSIRRRKSRRTRGFEPMERFLSAGSSPPYAGRSSWAGVSKKFASCRRYLS